MSVCAFLTTDDLSGYVTDDALAVAPLEERGWAVEFVPWRADAAWSRFDVVVIRTPWDYHADAGGFVAVLERIVGSGARLENALDTVRWNLDKRYLAELEGAGVPVVPTRWSRGLKPAAVEAAARAWGVAEVVVKPTVGASAHDAYRLAVRADGSPAAELGERFRDRGVMIQPYLPAVTSVGERSIVYVAGRYSHAIDKVPAPGDFRVQEEHGGDIRAVDPDEGSLDVARRALAAVPGPVPLYARVDLLPHPSLGPVVGELELIEPSLYLRMDAGAPHRFADAIAELSRGERPRD
jgi:glutathione synthase/RimK-type ligase-like ATP-grasp enzyme